MSGRRLYWAGVRALHACGRRDQPPLRFADGHSGTRLTSRESHLALVCAVACYIAVGPDKPRRSRGPKTR
jgi:hypothetical protein